MTINFTIPAAYLDAALLAVSKEETRYYLRGVFLDARGFVVATNGHIAFAAKFSATRVLDGEKPSYASAAVPGIIVPEGALKDVAKGKADVVTIERVADNLWRLTKGSLQTHFTPIDGVFPDWTRVIPEAPETETAAHYQPQYIAAIGAMARALRDGRKSDANFFHIHQSGEGPALVTFPTAETARTDPGGARLDCCAVISPMRATDAGGFNRSAFFAD